jgi:tight adherence protein B
VVVGVAALAFWRPLWLLAAAVLWAVLARQRRRRAGPGDEADFLQGLAAELGAGAALRSAVVAAAARAPALDLGRACRLAGAGLPAGEVGEALEAALPVNGRLAAAGFRLASFTGGRAAGLFHSLAGRAFEVGRLERERRALTAQARASAWVVGGLPIALLAMLVVTGRAGALLSDPAGPVVLAVGLGLEALGVGIVWLMVRGTGR